MVHTSLHLSMFITFLVIVKLGGIPNCGGIIFAGLSSVIFSVLFYSVGWSIWYFSIYVVFTVLIAVIQFIFDFPPEMPTEVNQLFFLINTLFISGLILVVVLVYLDQLTQAEKDKADRLKELDEVKTRLYTNITHEFRTPLTIILGMADQIEAQPEKWLKKGLRKIRQSSRSLLHLVNQMLDLARLEAGAMSMNMIYGDVIKYLKMMAEAHQSMAESNNIKLVFRSDIDSFNMDYDPEIIKQIVSNLLSNAIKYTPAKGTVSMNVKYELADKNVLVIRIEDTGIGIRPDEIERIFDRYFRVERDISTRAGGSGLGLAICRELVKLLNGDIQVSSEIHKGTEFVLKLPVSRDAPESESVMDSFGLELLNVPVPEPDVSLAQSSTRDEIPILLIVEDNTDVTDYLHSLLENDYRIHVAKNGRSGLEMAIRIVPDIILSDIMMPELDGIAMLDKLKKDIRTSHIPVILLTAKADIASRLEGLETGAEAYLAKPFNKEELFIRLRKLVEQRQKLRERYTSFILPEPDKDKLMHIEDSFMYKLHEAFRNNLGNEDFGIHQLCGIMLMSRAQLYRKLKALTNRSIKEYLRSFRLHIAKQLLTESELNVTQVAFEVGFRNLSHFSQRFREKYGIKPSEIRQEKS